MILGLENYFSNYPKHDSLFSVTSLQMRFWNHRSRPINHNPSELLRTQDLKPMYFENSSIYIFNRNKFLKIKNRIGKNPKMFEMSKIESFDIDDLDDFKLAEALHKNLNK